MIEFNGKRPLYSPSREMVVYTWPSCVEVDIEDTHIMLKPATAELHYSEVGFVCYACGCRGADIPFIWTNDNQMWERRDDRCNFAYIP